MEINQDKEFCQKHQQKTLWTSNKTCSLCELEEQVKQFMAVIDKENWEKMEQIWQEQKLEWLKQIIQLQEGSEEEQELGRQIKINIKKIDKKLQQVQTNSNSANSQPNSGMKNWLLIGGGIIILFLVGCLVWIFAKKKKKNKSDQEQLTTEKRPVQPRQLPKGKKINNDG